MDSDWARATDAIRHADALLITAGAGMGVESGLPDFRGKEGFWRAYPVAAELGLAFEQLANPEWFNRDPELAWAFYGHRLSLYRRTEPHAGFGQLLRLGASKRWGSFVFTSNVDGQFQKAGFDPARLVECHGSIHFFQCVIPCGSELWDASGEIVQVDEVRFRAVGRLPRCPFCGGMARPNILMFGDGQWVEDRTAGQQTLLDHWLGELEEAAARLVVVELGAGTAVPAVRRMSEAVCRGLGATLIRINPQEAEVPAGQVGLAIGARNGVAKLMQSLAV